MQFVELLEWVMCPCRCCRRKYVFAQLYWQYFHWINTDCPTSIFIMLTSATSQMTIRLFCKTLKHKTETPIALFYHFSCDVTIHYFTSFHVPFNSSSIKSSYFITPNITFWDKYSTSFNSGWMLDTKQMYQSTIL